MKAHSASSKLHTQPGAEQAVLAPTEAMLFAARGLIMARDLKAPNYESSLGTVARSGFYGDQWAHVLTDEERAIQAPLTKAHFAQLIWRVMEDARLNGERQAAVSDDKQPGTEPEGRSAPKPNPQEGLIKALEAMRGAIQWDSDRGYRMPYRVRDPLYAAIDLLGSAFKQETEK